MQWRQSRLVLGRRTYIRRRAENTQRGAEALCAGAERRRGLTRVRPPQCEGPGAMPWKFMKFYNAYSHFGAFWRGWVGRKNISIVPFAPPSGSTPLPSCCACT